MACTDAAEERTERSVRATGEYMMNDSVTWMYGMDVRTVSVAKDAKLQKQKEGMEMSQDSKRNVLYQRSMDEGERAERKK